MHVAMTAFQDEWEGLVKEIEEKEQMKENVQAITKENEQKTDIKEEEIDWDLGLGSASDDSIRFAEDIVQTNNPSNKRGQKKQSRRQNRPGKNRR